MLKTIAANNAIKELMSYMLTIMGKSVLEKLERVPMMRK
jgi:hypothetical protein